MKVAVKYINFLEQDDREKYAREVTALKALAHPVCLSYIGSTNSTSYGVIVTPFQPNGVLADVLKKEEGKEMNHDWATKKTKIAIGMAFGLEFIHKTGFMHRDLKPENVFLNGDFEPIIGGFGCATRVNSPDGDQTEMVGTPLQMAPELYDDQGYGQSVDVFAFAVSIYRMFKLSPNELVNVKNVEQLQDHYFKGLRYPRLESINDGYWNLITRAWDQDPRKRPTFEQIVNEMCENVSKFLFVGSDEKEVRRYISILKQFR
jgi:serine/threonine protein kinase